MAKGDHLIVDFGTYAHHGIDLGDGNVIHYGRGLHNKINARVEIVTWQTFCGDRPVQINIESAVWSSDAIVRRAESRLGENNYDLFDNNCEHFVNWCRKGVSDSSQVNLVNAVYRRGSAAVAKFARPKVTNRVVSHIAVRGGSKMAARPGLPAALAADAIQLSAEFFAIRNGMDREQSEMIGRRSGAVASSGIGFVFGGPVGAAAGFGSWLFGEVVGQKATEKTRRASRSNQEELDQPPNDGS